MYSYMKTYSYPLKKTKLLFLAHLSRRLKWAFMIIFCPLSVVVVVVLVNFLYFHFLLQIHWVNFNWHNASLVEGDSRGFFYEGPHPFPRGDRMHCKIVFNYVTMYLYYKLKITAHWPKHLESHWPTGLSLDWLNDYRLWNLHSVVRSQNKRNFESTHTIVIHLVYM